MIVLGTGVLGGTSLSTAALARGGGFGGGHFGDGFGAGHMAEHFGAGHFGGFHEGHEHGELRHGFGGYGYLPYGCDYPYHYHYPQC
jgi:hypothetical protein